MASRLFCIFVKDVNEHYSVKIRDAFGVKLFENKADAHLYAASIGLKHYCVKYEDWLFQDKTTEYERGLDIQDLFFYTDTC